MLIRTQTLLEDQPATPTQQRAIGAACLLLTAVTIGLLPITHVPLAKLPEVAGVFGTTVAVVDLITSLLLASRVGNDASLSIRTIACAYLFSGLMALLHVATFPGAVLHDAPLIGSRDTVGLLFLAWRFGFSLLLLIGVSLDRKAAPRQPTAAGMLGAAAVTVGVVSLCLYLAVWIPQHLPDATGGAFGRGPWAAAWLAAIPCVVALIVIWRTKRLRRTLYLWIGFVLLANTLGLCLSESGGARYTVGWYAARAYGVLASAVVLTLLLQEVLRLQRSLAANVAMLGQQAQELQAEIHRRETAERKLARVKQLEVVGQLAGGVAHDFNNHLHVIRTRLELLRRRTGPSAGIEADLDVLARTLRRAEGLTQHLLSVSGRHSPQPQHLQLAQWLPPFIDLLRSTIPAQVAFQFDVQPDIGDIYVDAGELESALTNLVANARDASNNADGRIDLVVRERALIDDSRQATTIVEISVSDNGHGMSTDVLQRAFEPFFSTKEAGRGYGLGLSQVKTFAERCNGTVSIASELGHGTTVSLAFPRMDAIEPLATEIGTGQRPMPAAIESIRGMAVLVVDDNDDVAASTAALLEHIGLIVRCSSNVQAGFDLLARSDWQPRLVITDIVMPGASDGLAFARLLRQSRPEIAVVLCTGFSQSASEALEDGFTILRKPYQPDELERQIMAAVRNVSHVAGHA
jgi:signal transduction histidine kinase/ActR/RegA family two-component response regulator